MFASTLRTLLKKGVSDREAKGAAAKKAWNTVKSRGAKTKIAVLGNRNVPILRVTDELYKSLLPGRIAGDVTYVPRRDQVVEINPSDKKLVLGTKVDHAKFVNKARPIIPPNAHLWIDAAVAHTDRDWETGFCTVHR